MSLHPTQHHARARRAVTPSTLAVAATLDLPSEFDIISPTSSLQDTSVRHG